MEIRQRDNVAGQKMKCSLLTVTLLLLMLNGLPTGGKTSFLRNCVLLNTPGDVDSVHITRLSVPRVYVLDNYHRHRHQHRYLARSQLRARDSDPDIPFDPEPDPLAVEVRIPDPAEHLVLDCEYVIEQYETGFVLKWLHNDVPIYQWIPPHRSPSSLNWMRDHVNRTFTVGNEAMHKHRALALMHPSQDFAGKYSCSVHTYQSFDIKSADLFVIVPESGFVLKYYRNLSDLVTVICSVYGIFPSPELSLWINDYRLENGSVNELAVADGLFDSSISVQLVLYESLQPDDVIKCMLTIPATEYGRTKETVFVDVNSKPFGESNSILDPFGTAVSSSTGSPGKLLLLSTATSSTPSAVPTDPPSTPEVASTKVTASNYPNPAATEPEPAKGDPVRSQIPSVIRLRPTASSTRVLTVQQSNSVESDEIMNVLDFKELLNENLLYNNGGARLGLHRFRTCDWLRFVVLVLGFPALLAGPALAMLRRWQLLGS